MTDLAHSHRVAEAVIRQERLSTSSEDFLKNLSVEQVPNTQDIEVAYTDTDPERAQRVVNAVGEVFSREVAEVSQSTNAITATLWDRAAVPEEPVSPIPLLNGLLALLLGLMLGVGLAFLLEYLDDSWRSPEEVEQLTGVPTYGVIPTMAFSKDKEGQG
jgi:capsular polysaccharide biosynthesis protein